MLLLLLIEKKLYVLVRMMMLMILLNLLIRLGIVTILFLIEGVNVMVLLDFQMLVLEVERMLSWLTIILMNNLLLG